MNTHNPDVVLADHHHPAEGNTPVGTDSLTGIGNRRAIQAALVDSMALSGRYSVPVSVILLDVDSLAEINERHGNDAGDAILESIAALLLETVRLPDKVGRYSGSQFLVVLPHTKQADARRIADRVRSALAERRFHVDGSGPLTVGISGGVAACKKSDDIAALLGRAEKALTEAKAKGQNQIVSAR